MRKLLLILSILVLGQNLFAQEVLIKLPNPSDEHHTVTITFSNAHNFVLCEFDRLVEGSVQIFFNDEPTPQIINSGQCQQFAIDPKVQPIKKIKIIFTSNSDIWVRFQTN